MRLLHNLVGLFRSGKMIRCAISRHRDDLLFQRDVEQAIMAMQLKKREGYHEDCISQDVGHRCKR